MFPQQTQTANCAGFLGHCKDRPLWLLHNCEALGQLVAIKIMEEPPHSATLDPRNRDSGSEQSSCWLSGTQRVSESGLQLTIYRTDPCGVRELGFLSAFSVRKILSSLSHLLWLGDSTCELRVSQRFVLGLSSLFDDGNKTPRDRSQLDRKQATEFWGAWDFFFYLQMEKFWHGHSLMKIYSVWETQTGQGLADGLETSRAVVLESAGRVKPEDYIYI